MPLYEYQCDRCEHRFELIQRFSDPPPHVCPKCGGPVTKLLSSPAIQFKGSGWYITDYARKGGGGESASGKTDGKGAAASSTEKPATGGGDASAAKTTSGAGTNESSAPKTETK
jgi:putative FmdB family regulatory protein